jgi:asparagine synthase (glutamine-hydrolysing)
MCGICGIFDLSGAPVSEAMISAMTETMVHRGPDDGGMHLDGPVGLGFRRLSIVDLAAGHQPMANEDRSVWIVFNGEIYNHADLRPGLMAKGHSFATRADTEAIIHLYEEEGERFVEQLQGMFGLAIWDSRRRRLTLARDRFGIKPLYWVREGDRVIFGSEIKAILKALHGRPEINTADVAEFMNFGFLAGRRTMFRNIQSLLPGSTVTFSPEGTRERVFYSIPLFWDTPPAENRAYNGDEWMWRVRTGLDLAVNQRFMADVPFGIMLSGGVDSSLMTLRAQKLRPDPLDTFNVRMPPPVTDEGPYAEAIAKIAGTRHREVYGTEEKALDLLWKMAWHHDEPLCFDNGVWVYSICSLAREHGEKILLSGEGADEVFGGYIRYKETLQRYYNLEHAGATGSLTSRALACGGHDGLARCLSLDETLLLSSAVYSAHKVGRLLGTVEWDNPYRHEVLERSLRIGDPIRSLMAQDQAIRLVALLYRMDKMGMASSVEVRVPYLDHRFVEEATAIPSELLIHADPTEESGFATKYLLKQLAVNEGAPREAIYRRKVGLATPMSDWLKNRDGLGRFLTNLLDRQGRGVFDPKAIRAIWDDHISGKEDSRVVLWWLTSFEMWAEQFLDV